MIDGILLGVALSLFVILLAFVIAAAIKVYREKDEIQRMIDQQRWAEDQLRKWENDNHVR